VTTYPRPWAATCTCGHIDRSATSPGAHVLADAHRTSSRRGVVGGTHSTTVTKEGKP
jgi:hypothetical protein